MFPLDKSAYYRFRIKKLMIRLRKYMLIILETSHGCNRTKGLVSIMRKTSNVIHIIHTAVLFIDIYI